MATTQTYMDLVFRHGMILIPIKPGTKAPKIRGYQNKQGITPANWPKRFDPSIQYASCPHNANLAVLDFDRTTEHTKADLAAMPEREAKELMLEHLQDFYTRHPYIFDKKVHLNWSGSGRGLHLWLNYVTHDEDGIGRTKFASGDVFAGDGYVLLYDPASLRDALDSAADIEPVTGDELRDIVGVDEKTLMPRISRSRPAHEAPVSADELITILGTGKGIGTRHAIEIVERLATEIYGAEHLESMMHAIMTPHDAEYKWTPLEIACQFGRIPRHYWDDYHFWLWTGMALRSLSDYPDKQAFAFDIWSAFSDMSDKYDPMDQYRVWSHLRSAADTDDECRTMGTVCYISGAQDYAPPAPVDLSDIAYFSQKLQERDGAFITNADLYKAYVASGGANKRKTFSKVLGIRLKERGFEPSARQGNRGWRGISLAKGEGK